MVWEAYRKGIPLLGAPENPIDFKRFRNSRPPTTAVKESLPTRLRHRQRNLPSTGNLRGAAAEPSLFGTCEVQGLEIHLLRWIGKMKGFVGINVTEIQPVVSEKIQPIPFL